MKNIQFILFLSLFIAIFLKPALAVDKYTVKQRFGAGGVGWNHSIDELPWQQLGIGWYQDWNSGCCTDQSGGPRNGLEYLGMAGGYTASYPDSPTAPSCQSLKTRIQSSPSKYPNGMMWTIGNEIGWDVNMGPLTAATHYEKWRNCLKDINPSFQVGTGAIASIWVKLAMETSPGGGCASGLSDPSSGLNYFDNYLGRIIADANGDTSKYPDLIVTHGYPNCVSWDVTSLQTLISETRKVMKKYGLQNKDLVIKEFGDNRTDISYDTRLNFLSSASNLFLTYKDTNLGQSNDDYRMVQRWAWFILNIWPNFADNPPSWEPFQLIDTFNYSSNYPLTSLGQNYKNIITNSSGRPPSGITDILSFRQLLQNFLSIFDYNQLITNYGK